MTRVGAWLAFAATLFGGVGDASGYIVQSSPKWPDGTVQLELQLGSTPVYTDGSTPNSTAAAALDMWNPYMKRVQLSAVQGSSSATTQNNGSNNVYFSAKVQDQEWGSGVLAVTLIRYNPTTRLETDVLVNSGASWDSYRGSLHQSKIDLRRVLGHEFGHVLGLSHPDASGQTVAALMNSFVSDIDTSAADDHDGIGSIYGRGTADPAIAPTLQTNEPGDQTAVAGQDATLTVYPQGTVPFTFQWRKDGIAILGATQNTLVIHSTAVSDAGNYSVVVSNEAGSVTSRAAKLTVTVPDPPVISSDQPADQTITEAQRLSLYVSAHGALPITYQWLKNGVPIQNETNGNFEIVSVTQTSAGDYQVTATNAGGTAMSRTAHVTVTPIPSPRPSYLSDQNVQLGASLYLGLNVDSQFGPYSYQWYRDGLVLPGATAATYFVQQVSYADAGNYLVVVKNRIGSTTSNYARVNVLANQSTTASSWLVARRAGDIVYFLFGNPARIERFDLNSDGWLAPISLPHTPTQMTVFNDSIYIAFGASISKFPLAGGTETPLVTLDASPGDMIGFDGYLYLQLSDSPSRTRFTSINLSTLQTNPATNVTLDAGPGFSVDPVDRILFSHATGSSPSGISSNVLNADGTFAGSIHVPYVETYSGFNQTYVFPDTTRVCDSSGLVYSTSDLSYVGSLGSFFQDAAFNPDNSCVLLRAGTELSEYGSNLRLQGSLNLASPADRIVVRGRDVIAFTHASGAGSSITWQKVSLDAITTPAVAAPLDPSALTYTVDGLWFDGADSQVLIFNRNSRNVFRWSVAEQRYLASLPLSGLPNYVDYSMNAGALFISDAHNLLGVRPTDPAATETMVVNLASQPTTVIAAGGYILASPANFGYYGTFDSYDTDGLRKANFWLSGDLQGFAWSPIKRRLYYAGSFNLDYIEVLPDGTTGATKESTIVGASNSLKQPIRISPNGDSVLAGNGSLFDADTLQQSYRLPNSIDDAAWIGQTLFTGQTTYDGILLQRWGGLNYGRDATATLDGRLLRIFSVGPDELLVVATKGDHPQFTLLDHNLNTLTHSASAPLDTGRLANVSTRADIGTGDGTVIAGFVVNGTANKRILARAAGPALLTFGVSDAVSDPVLKLYSDQTLLATNDDWDSSAAAGVADSSVQVGAFAFPDGSKDSALLIDLPPGAYTAQMSGKSGAAGVGLVEIYDLDASTAQPRMLNISTRAVVGVGGKILIPGVVVQGITPKRLLFRAVGPTLATFNVSGTLADPQIEIVAADGHVVASNDDWGSDNVALITASASAAGAFPLTPGSKDAALVTTLSPGSYTVRASGVNDSTGVALVEIYEVP